MIKLDIYVNEVRFSVSVHPVAVRSKLKTNVVFLTLMFYFNIFLLS